MRIKDICRSQPSNHYMLTPSAIHHLGIKINEFNINPQTQEKFAKIVQKIYYAIFVSLYKVSLKTNRDGKNSHQVKI